MIINTTIQVQNLLSLIWNFICTHIDPNHCNIVYYNSILIDKLYDEVVY